MKERIEHCNVLYDSWQMQCCGDPIEVGKVADLTIDTSQKPWVLAGYQLDFFEEHHGDANAKLRGKVISIEAVFIIDYADEERYTDNPNNKFALYDATFIDGYDDVGDFGNHKTSDVCYYIITLKDAVVGVYNTVHDYISNRRISLNLLSDNILENCEGHNQSDASSITVYRDEKKLTIEIPKSITHRLVEWYKGYKSHINEGFSVWSQNEWYAWYVRGWVIMKEIKEMLPDDIILYYGDMGMSRGVITQIRDSWAVNDGGRGVQIVSNMADKISEGIYIPRTIVDWNFEKDDERIYKLEISRSEHHFFPSDMVILKVWGWSISEGYKIATVIECQDDGIIVQAYDWVDTSEEYSVELID